MPKPVRALVSAVVVCGVAIVLGCAVALAGQPLPEPGLLALLALGAFLAELRPVRIPGGTEETSFSTAFSFALLVSHGIEATVLVSVAAVVAADAIRRPALVKIFYNGGQYAISWALAGLLYEALAGPAVPLDAAGAREFAALVPAGLTFALVNGALAPLPPALLRGGPVLPQLLRELGFIVGTTIVLLALAPCLVVMAARDLWLVPLATIPLVGIQLGSRQALINEAHARIDPLTGLFSRAALEQALERRLGDPGHAPAIVVCDLSAFSDVNDALGHRAGDEVLQTVAERIAGAVTQSDVVARTGGDAFAVLCDDDAAEAIVARIEAALDAPLPVAGLEIDVRIVSGIAGAPAHDATTLLRQADVALRAAKERGARRVRFEPVMAAAAAERLALAPELRRAIGAGELVLHYQPKVDVRTGALAGVEALVRWNRPGHGLVPPDVFIDLAERTGLIRPLTSWVLRAAIADQAMWAASGLRIPVAVNLSARALHPTVVGEVAALLEPATGELELEITESAAMRDPARGLAVLERLAELGVRLSIDDFGTGHASLAYLEQLPVGALKIDRTFVGGLERQSANRSIVSTTIELGHRLGLEVVAEGVEDDATLATLRSLGCDHAQGFGIARPMPADAVPVWVASSLPWDGDSSATPWAAASDR
jgi:diguanylate cyclase (GGDEF)-like protein